MIIFLVEKEFNLKEYKSYLESTYLSFLGQSKTMINISGTQKMTKTRLAQINKLSVIIRIQKARPLADPASGHTRAWVCVQGRKSGHRVGLGSRLRPLSRCMHAAWCSVKRAPNPLAHFPEPASGWPVRARRGMWKWWPSGKHRSQTQEVPSLWYPCGPCPSWCNLRIWTGSVKKKKICSALQHNTGPRKCNPK